jgi:ABC-type dipeptide/oligopeptide/nickel transport system permease component
MGLLIEISLALFVAYFRETYIDRAGIVLCVAGMSLSILLYIIGGQYLLGKVLRWFPISGFDPRRPCRAPGDPGRSGSARLAVVRFYRTVFMRRAARLRAHRRQGLRRPA